MGQPGDPHGGVGLVAAVDLEQGWGQGFDGEGARQAAGIDAPEAGQPVDQRGHLPGGGPIVGAHQHVRIEGMIEVGPGLGREMVEGADHPRPGQGPGHRDRHRAGRRDERHHVAAPPGEGVRHRDHDLAGQRLLQRGDRGQHAFPGGGDDHQLGRRPRRRCRPGAAAGRGRAIVPRSSATAASARSIDREPTDTSTPA